MKRGVWLGGMVLSLGGWLARVNADDPSWQPPVPTPIPLSVTGAEGPAASLGRPVVIATSRPLTPTAPALPEVTPVSLEQPATPALLPLATTRVQPPTLPIWPDETDGTIDTAGLIEQVSLFASDRNATVPRSAIGAASSIRRVSAESEDAPVPKKTDEKTPEKKTPEKAPAPLPADLVPAPNLGMVPDLYDVDGPVPNPLDDHFYAKGEYLLWSTKGYRVPPLVTTANAPNVGILGENSTRTLFGDSNLDASLRSGFRLFAGCWFDMWLEDGVELGGFYLGEQNKHFATDSGQNPVIARPFFELNRNREFAELVSFPGLQLGSVAINSPSNFFGVEGNYRAKLCCGCDYRADLLVGFRYLNLDDDLSIAENIIFGSSPALGALANQVGTAVDDFHTKNHFYGGQVGVAGEKHWGAWSLEGRAKLALGATAEEVSISGFQRFAPNGALSARGGLLALPSNIGNFEQTRFAIVPEIELNVGYQITEHLRAFVGYNFLYWNRVVRPGDQIDRVLDSSAIPNFAGGAPANLGRPAVPFKETDFWAQGVNVGLEFRY